MRGPSITHIERVLDSRRCRGRRLRAAAVRVIVGRTDAMMLDREMIAAWRTAAQELEIGVLAPHILLVPGRGAVEVEAFLPHFGRPDGAAAIALDLDHPEDDERPRLLSSTKYFVSSLNPERYRVFDRRLFQETLDDWGWYGPGERRPPWYTGKPWS